MDFSDADPADFVLTGTFGWCDSDENLVLEGRGAGLIIDADHGIRDAAAEQKAEQS